MNYTHTSEHIYETMQGFGKTRRYLKGEEELLITSTNLNEELCTGKPVGDLKFKTNISRLVVC